MKSYFKSCWIILCLIFFSPLLVSSYDPCLNDPKTIRDAIKITAIETAIIAISNITGQWWLCLVLFLLSIFGGAFLITDFNEDTYSKEE